LEKLTLKCTSRMKKNIRMCKKRGYDLTKLEYVTNLLLNRQPLNPVYKDHELQGEWADHRELHIQGDWLLIYQIIEKELILKECRTGTHSDLFEKVVREAEPEYII